MPHNRNVRMPEPKSALNDTSGSEREPSGAPTAPSSPGGTRCGLHALKPHRLIHHPEKRQPHPRALSERNRLGIRKHRAAAGARRPEAPGKERRLLPEERPVQPQEPVPASWILHDEAEDRQTGGGGLQFLPVPQKPYPRHRFGISFSMPETRAACRRTKRGTPGEVVRGFSDRAYRSTAAHEPHNNAPLLKGRAQQETPGSRGKAARRSCGASPERARHQR